ncbi:CGNR zinc finger domain-containing protein [Cohnella lubricantis]|uniref:CGNR zinc finger domain-containing protein n=1 Tax=Cohnella lubricantis TaxID=2163172 RepID=A0A841TDB7_9BACL|nr:CGNR zinc finger domain-containing protein [Cohnella lubricantis]MBB6678196.1 CGNR zinc finger domain-containing protein [Cohnella lubricantis]MBP2119677.1 putative RNA-binding Zn ribbon-like protein [Cohnella lubricantis]
MLWDDFLNSDYHDWRGGGRSEDRLDRPGWLLKLLSQYQIAADRPPNLDELAELKRLRSLMLAIVHELVQGREPSSDAVASLNATLSQGAVIRKLAAEDGRFTLRQTPAASGWQQIMAEIAATFAEMLVHNEPSRVRICDNPDCLWVYYDETRNRSKRYCDDKMCGNVMKVRRFRARRKAEASAPPGEK